MQKKKRGSKFSEWKNNFSASIQSSKINESDASELNSLIKQIIKKNELDSPNQKETDDFIDSFLPLIIYSIIECRSCDKVTQSCYQNILAHCLLLLKHFMIKYFENVSCDHEVFISSARKILENPNCAFFNLSFDQNYKASLVYLDLRKRFTDKDTLEKISSCIISDHTISLQKLQEIADIILPINSYFDPSELGTFALNIARYLYKIAKGLEPREINETEINQIFFTLSRYETLSSQVRSEISQNQVKILIKVVKSDLLTKQFSALEAIKNICFLNPDLISPILSKGGIIDFLLSIDLHVKLVDSFSSIFSIMNANKCITKNQLQQLWKKTIEQPQSTFPTFLAGMKRVADQMYPIDQLCH